jgi:hypothetical protein
MKPWQLLVLLAAVFYTYDYFPLRAATAMAFLGLLCAVLLWTIRGPRTRVMWPICMFGVVEGLEVFGCQLALNWVPRDAPRFHGVCEAYTGLPMYGWGISALAFLAYLVAKEIPDG